MRSAAILEKYQADMGGVAEGGAAYDAEGAGEAGLTALQQAAAEIDAIYASDVEAPAHWQDKPTLKKELRAQVRRLIQRLGLKDWQKDVPKAVEDYAVHQYGKP